MKTTVREWDGRQPPEVAPLIGLKVERAWLLGKTTLALRLEKQRFLRVDPTPFVGDMRACVALEIGTIKTGATFSNLDSFATPSPHTEEICGMAFTGIDADIVMFGNYGARITPTGIEWVRAA